MHNDKCLKLSWATINDLVDSLALMVAPKRPSLVVGVSRGGLVPATMLSHRLNKPLELIQCSAYTGTKRTSFPVEVKGWQGKYNSPSVIIVDDILDTGDTYATLMSFERAEGSEFTFATLVNKQCIRFGAFRNYVMQVPKEVWIQFPWEVLDAPF